MKVYKLDIPIRTAAGAFTHICVKGNKAILIPPGHKPINAGSLLPHTQDYNNPALQLRENKYCHKCKEFRSLVFFNKNVNAADGYKDTCRYCDNKTRRERYAKRAKGKNE